MSSTHSMSDATGHDHNLRRHPRVFHAEPFAGAPEPTHHPVIVLSANNNGKALGMLLDPELKAKSLAVIDELDIKEGDFIDIGLSYFGGDIVPVTIKSLVFPG